MLSASATKRPQPVRVRDVEVHGVRARGARSRSSRGMAAATRPSMLNELRTLLVEEHGPLRDRMESVLRCAGCVVETAYSEPSARAAATMWVPDIVLVDLAVSADPIFFGQVLRDLLPEHALLIAVCAGDLPADWPLAFDARYTRPFNPIELRTIMEAWFAQVPATCHQKREHADRHHQRVPGRERDQARRGERPARRRHGCDCADYARRPVDPERGRGRAL